MQVHCKKCTCEDWTLTGIVIMLMIMISVIKHQNFM